VKPQFPAAIRQTAGPAEARAKAIAMDYETEPLSKLARNCDFGGSTHRPGRPSTQSTTPQIKMFVSEWYTDELGNRARIIKAYD